MSYLLQRKSMMNTESDDFDTNEDNLGTLKSSKRRKKQFAESTGSGANLELTAARLTSLQNKGPVPTTCADKQPCSCCCCCATRIGSMYSFIETRDGTPICMLGPCFPICFFVTFPIIAIGSFLVIYFVLLDREGGVPVWLLPVYSSLVGYTLLTLCCVSCRNPGLIERITDEEAGERGMYWNEQCGSFRPSGATYCKECKVLIQDYDHVCPWTGTAIGRGNVISFRLFLISSNLLCYGSVAIVLWYTLRK